MMYTTLKTGGFFVITVKTMITGLQCMYMQSQCWKSTIAQP